MNDSMRGELSDLLTIGNAHMSFEDVVEDFPLDLIGRHAPHTPYTAWHFVEHIRIAQWDIVEFIRTPNHQSPDWPYGYRPPARQMPTEDAWFRSIDQVLHDREYLISLLNKPTLDLLSEIPHAPGYTYFREILTVADHTAYHVGEIALLRQVLNAWPEHNRYLTG
ncbi:MAG: DinB family protein [Chitinivibrionales bacterium]